ncbi:MAG TPA: DUF1493 family protein [Flavobacterium sp.]|nr:DUF1493 family protein [Flavobacterium sp.]
MDYQEETVLFFRSITGLKNINLDSNIASPEFSIFDLDAEHIMRSFFNKFNVKSSGFKTEDYFQYPDYSWKNMIIFRPFFKQKPYPVKSRLTLYHLADVAKKGIWFAPLDN